MDLEGAGPDPPETVILSIFLRGLVKIGGKKVLAIHYFIVFLLLAVAWEPSMGTSIRHPEILVKLVGTYCFIIGTFAIPLTAHELFPSPGDRDPAFETLPMDYLRLFDARLRAVLIASTFALLPIVPIFLVFDPFIGRSFDILDILPFFTALISAIWVHLLMEMVSKNNQPGVRIVRRMSVVASFVLLHLGLVGTAGRLARVFIQRTDFLKILIDLNPFSQLYILMEGAQQRWLIFNIGLLDHVDYRVYLVLIQLIFLAILLAIYRAMQKTSDD